MAVISPIIQEVPNLTAHGWQKAVPGAFFGGDATPIGTAANIVIVSLSKGAKTPITPKLWVRKGLPVALATCIVGSILFALAYPLLGR